MEEDELPSLVLPPPLLQERDEPDTTFTEPVGSVFRYYGHNFEVVIAATRGIASRRARNSWRDPATRAALEEDQVTWARWREPVLTPRQRVFKSDWTRRGVHPFVKIDGRWHYASQRSDRSIAVSRSKHALTLPASVSANQVCSRMRPRVFAAMVYWSVRQAHPEWTIHRWSADSWSDAPLLVHVGAAVAHAAFHYHTTPSVRSDLQRQMLETTWNFPLPREQQRVWDAMIHNAERLSWTDHSIRPPGELADASFVHAQFHIPNEMFVTRYVLEEHVMLRNVLAAMTSLPRCVDYPLNRASLSVCRTPVRLTPREMCSIHPDFVRGMVYWFHGTPYVQRLKPEIAARVRVPDCWLRWAQYVFAPRAPLDPTPLRHTPSEGQQQQADDAERPRSAVDRDVAAIPAQPTQATQAPTRIIRPVLVFLPHTMGETTQ